MRPYSYTMLPPTVQFTGDWTVGEQAQTYAALVPVAHLLTSPWMLICEQKQVEERLFRAEGIFRCYSAATTRDGATVVALAEVWTLAVYLQRLLTLLELETNIQQPLLDHIAPPAAVQPSRSISPLERGRWYTKRAFEKHYFPKSLRQIVIFECEDIQVRVQTYSLQQVLKQHKFAYFQLAWNEQAYSRQAHVPVRAHRQGGVQLRSTTLIYKPGTTVVLRICYALTPQRDTEQVLYDGVGLPEWNRWWEQAAGHHILLTKTRPLDDEHDRRAQAA